MPKGVQLVGTSKSTVELQLVWVVNTALPPEHVGFGAPHAQALQSRVSSKLVSIIFLSV